MFDLLFFGAFAMIIVYNLGYSMIMKSVAYISYLMFHITLFLIILFYTGMVENSWFDFNLHGVSVGVFFLSVVMFLGFTREFLDLKLFYPKIENYFNKLIILNAGLVLLSAYSVSNHILEVFAISLIVAEVVGLLALSSHLSLKKRYIYARFYILSFAPLLMTLAFTCVNYFILGDVYKNTPYLFEIAILIEASGLSFALAYKQKASEIALKQNELLFQELSHRVQNSLQQIISILTLQINSAKDAQVQAHLEDTIRRIGSISLIHKTLQNSESVGKVNMQKYLRALINAYKQLHQDVVFTLKCDTDIELGIKKLTPLALIINELITNSLKHAFKNKEDKKISITLQDGGSIKFIYEDNGGGFKEESISSSVGSKLIKILSQSELKGKVDVDATEHYRFSLEFSV